MTTSGRGGACRVVVLLVSVWLASACVPPAKANRCAWSGDFGGSTACIVPLVEWRSADDTTYLVLESRPTADQPMIEIQLRLAGQPQPGSFVLEQKSPGGGLLEEIGCDVFVFGTLLPGDGTRNRITFGPEPASTCTLKLEEVEPLTDAVAPGNYVAHGTLQTRIAGGASSLNPDLKRADLFAGF